MTPSRNVVAVTDEAVERLKALAEKATRGPWLARSAAYGFDIFTPIFEELPPVWIASITRPVGARDGDGRDYPPRAECDANAAFIAACDPQTILALIALSAAYPSMVAEVERLTKTLTDMRDRDDRNGSLPIWYREQIDAALTEAKTP